MFKLDTSYLTPTRVDKNGTFQIIYDRGRKDRLDTPEIRFISEYDVTEPKGIRWLWPGKIPLGVLTVIEGPPGEGKSFLTAELAARVSRGAPWFDAPPGPQLAGEVIYVCPERISEDTIKPRIIRTGSDILRVLFLSTASMRDRIRGGMGQRTLEFPQDISMLEYHLKECPYTRLVVVDPIREYCATPRQLRTTLIKLDELAAKYNVAIVATIQADVKFSRDGQMKRNARTWDEAARCVWCMTRDPDDPELYRLEPKRTTFCRTPAGAAFRIDGRGVVAWEPLPPRIPPLQTCMAWLEELLSQGAVWSAEGLRAAAEFGFSDTLVQKARDRLQIRSDRQGGIAGKGKWWWTKDGRPPAGEDIPPREESLDLVPAAVGPGSPSDKSWEATTTELLRRQKLSDEFVEGLAQVLRHEHPNEPDAPEHEDRDQATPRKPAAEASGHNVGDTGARPPEPGNNPQGDTSPPPASDILGADQSAEGSVAPDAPPENFHSPNS